MVRSGGQNPQTTKILLPCKCFEIRFLAEHNSIPTTLHWCPGILTAINQMIGFPSSWFHTHHTCYMCVMPSSMYTQLHSAHLNCFWVFRWRAPWIPFSLLPWYHMTISLSLSLSSLLFKDGPVPIAEAFWPLGMPTLCTLNIVPRSLLFFSFWATTDTITISSRSSSTSQHYIRKICQHRASYCPLFSSHPVFFPLSLQLSQLIPILIEHSTSISQ